MRAVIANEASDSWTRLDGIQPMPIEAGLHRGFPPIFRQREVWGVGEINIRVEWLKRALGEHPAGACFHHCR